MELSKWMELIKGKKKAESSKRVKLVAQRSAGVFTLENLDEQDEALRIDFGANVEMTVFEADLLFSLFIKGRLPFDYARYHESEVGQRFIASIKSVQKAKMVRLAEWEDVFKED